MEFDTIHSFGHPVGVLEWISGNNSTLHVHMSGTAGSSSIFTFTIMATCIPKGFSLLFVEAVYEGLYFYCSTLDIFIFLIFCHLIRYLIAIYFVFSWLLLRWSIFPYVCTFGFPCLCVCARACIYKSFCPFLNCFVWMFISSFIVLYSGYKGFFPLIVDSVLQISAHFLIFFPLNDSIDEKLIILMYSNSLIFPFIVTALFKYPE